MCLLVKLNQKRDEFGYPLPTTARQDTICYKWLDKNDHGLQSPYYPDGILRIGQKMKVTQLGIGRHGVCEGIHAFTSKKVALRYNEQTNVIVQCIIPKGAQYIRGENNQIVATEMKLKRVIAEDGKIKRQKGSLTLYSLK